MIHLKTSVSILTGPEGPVLRGVDRTGRPPGQVSILTGPEGPVLRDKFHLTDAQLMEVSILTGPEGPVLHGFLSHLVFCALAFQSSPAPKGRCCVRILPGAPSGPEVSILTGPEGPVLPGPGQHPRILH